MKQDEVQAKVTVNAPSLHCDHCTVTVERGSLIKTITFKSEGFDTLGYRITGAFQEAMKQLRKAEESQKNTVEEKAP